MNTRRIAKFAPTLSQRHISEVLGLVKYFVTLVFIAYLIYVIPEQAKNLVGLAAAFLLGTKSKIDSEPFGIKL